MPKGRPKGSKNIDDSLLGFAKRVEQQIIKAGIPGSEDMERLVCRLMTNNKIPGVAAVMASKWVEWRYGRAAEKHEHKLTVEMKVEDADALIRSYFISASTGSDSASESDQMQAAQQDRKLLPS